jgi:asparagine synthase (glutamine-hydrolysing)
MCGICGIYAPGRVDPEILRRMSSTLVHRGPDDEGTYTDARVGLASRRLAIIDLARGRMPIANEDGSVWVVQNGEIYNFQNLRRDLEARGHRFATNTDTEVLVHLYEEHGEHLFPQLRGMFAVALWDRERDVLLLGRDRVGKKPLYYSADGGRLLFASEIKALRQVPDLELSLDWEALNLYFSYQFVPDPWSIYREIRKLPPAHYLKLHAGRFELASYWDLDFEHTYAETDERWYVERLRELVTDAVRARLVSDVPLGAFLSGGIDSATVVGLMSRLVDAPVKTFSIGFDEETYDELRYARIAARAFGTDHHEEILSPRAADLVERLLEHFDEPFGDPSALPTWLVSQVARRRVTVVLSGDGGDEAFAGYESHRVHARDERFHRRVPAPLRALACGGLDLGARLTGGRRLRRMAGAVRRAHAPLQERYSNVFDKRARRRLYSPQARERIGTLREQEYIAARAGSQRFPDLVSRLLYVDTRGYLPHDVLVKVDRMSMAHSLEVRSPLIDHHVLEFAARIPSHLKLRHGVSKYIFKRMAEEFVPREIVRREKHGFGVPLESWFRKELRELVREHLLHSRDGAQRLFDRPFVERLVREHESGRWDWSLQLWSLLVFHLWYGRYAPRA